MANVKLILMITLIVLMWLVVLAPLTYLIIIPAVRERLRFQRVQRERRLNGLPPLPSPIRQSQPREQVWGNSHYAVLGGAAFVTTNVYIKEVVYIGTP